MSYQIVRSMPEVPVTAPQRTKSDERITMERLGIGDGFWTTEYDAAGRARSARFELAPKKFTVRKVPGQGWQVRRTT